MSYSWGATFLYFLTIGSVRDLTCFKFIILWVILYFAHVESLKMSCSDSSVPARTDGFMQILEHNEVIIKIKLAEFNHAPAFWTLNKSCKIIQTTGKVASGVMQWRCSDSERFTSWEKTMHLRLNFKSIFDIQLQSNIWTQFLILKEMWSQMFDCCSFDSKNVLLFWASLTVDDWILFDTAKVSKVEVHYIKFCNFPITTIILYVACHAPCRFQ